MRLNERVALITGAGRGVGEAIARRFAEEGSIVIVSDIVEDNIQSLANELNAKGLKAMAIPVNVTNKNDVEAMVEKVVSTYGRLDILVNNAAVNKDALIRKMTEEQWDAVIDINLKGSFLCAKAAMGPMIEQKYGKINNTASIGALGNVGQANYAASKCGVIGLTKVLALELARYNVNVNCVAPGGTETAMTAGIPEGIRQKLIDAIPFKRFAKPVEVANMHLFFASDEASYITGQVIFVDGGDTIGF
ncbi:MAG: beta-ketoacyl-ACP reductase [Desulfosporosinus sp. BRH_c37]|nr:MAG: beta-ketoacyl-ACP reductase [Desulfosporosinus sp. BRH_c37]